VRVGGGGHQAYIDIYVYILTDLSDLCFKMSSFGSPGVAIRRIADLPIQNYLRNYPSVQLRNYTAE